MRINIYTEELTNEAVIVEKNGFHGLRLYLKSPQELHHTPDDDDRSAVTFWGLTAVKDVVAALQATLQREQVDVGAKKELRYIGDELSIIDRLLHRGGDDGDSAKALRPDISDCIANIRRHLTNLGASL